MKFWKKEFGSTMVEFVVVAPVLLMLGLGTVQMGFVYHAKTTLNYATFEAARIGAVNHADIEPMKNELAYRLAPLYGGRGSDESAGAAIGRSMADSINPLAGKITIINPTADMFDSWAVTDSESGELQIPNHHLRHQNDDVRAGVTLHDANLLKIRSEYGYRLRIPVAASMIIRAMQVLYPEQAAYYANGRIRLSSVATVRMQNEVRRAGIEASDLAIAAGNSSTPFTEDTDASVGGIGFDYIGSSNGECDENGLSVQSNADFSSIDDSSAESAGFCEVPAGTFDTTPSDAPLSTFTPSDNPDFNNFSSC